LDLASHRFNRTLLQFKRRTLAFAALASLALLALGWHLGTDTESGTVMLGVATSILASLLVAATALEREEFAQDVLDLGVQRIFDDRLKGLDREMWTDLMGAAKTRFCVLGMANHGYLSNADAQAETREALQRALRRPKTEIEILWLNPDNEIARLREDEENKRGLRRDICASIDFFWKLRENLEPDQRKRFSMREYNNLPTCGLTWTDDLMIVTHYLAGELNLRAPGLVLTTAAPRFDELMARIRKSHNSAPPLASTYSANYREIASDKWSTPIDQDRVAALVKLQAQLEASQGDKLSEADLRGSDAEGGS